MAPVEMVLVGFFLGDKFDGDSRSSCLPLPGPRGHVLELSVHMYTMDD